MNDNEQILKLIKLNPNPKSNNIVINKGVRNLYYLIPKWLSGDNDKYYFYNKLGRKLKEFNISIQVYYDVLILGITNINDRPKCRYCGEYTKFTGLTTGYREYCNSSHKSKYIRRSEEFKKDLSEKLKGVGNPFYGKSHSSESKNKIRMARLGSTSSESTKSKIGNSMSMYFKNNPDKLYKFMESATRLDKKYKRGYINISKSKSPLRYMSSWELEFLKWCESSDEISEVSIPPTVDYTYEGRNHVYYPDFLLTMSDNRKVIVGIKPYSKLNNPVVITKRLYSEKLFLNSEYQYLIITENEIFNNLSIYKCLELLPNQQ